MLHCFTHFFSHNSHPPSSISLLKTTPTSCAVRSGTRIILIHIAIINETQTNTIIAYALNNVLLQVESSFADIFIYRSLTYYTSALVDIPVHKSRVQALHVLFTLYSEFKASQVCYLLSQYQLHLRRYSLIATNTHTL